MSRNLVCKALVAALLAWAGPAGASGALSGAAKADLAAIASLTGSAPGVAGVRGGHPTMLTGRLSAPVKGDAEAVARAFLAARPGLFPVSAGEIEVRRTVGHGLGRTVRFDQTYRGLPVVGAELAVTVDREGVVRIVSSALEDLGEVDTLPEVDFPEAEGQARARASFALPADRGHTWSRLVVLAFPGQGRLAWELHFGALPMLLSNVWAYVDARTGEVIRFENRVATYDGLAFATNPGHYGGPYTDPVEVVLDIPEGGFVFTEPDYAAEMIPETACDYEEGADDCVCPGDLCVRLSHPLFLARNCPDYHQTVPIDLSAFGLGEMNMHLCSEVQTAHQDADDDFFFEWEGDNEGLNDLDMTDKFAEVQMFHHVAGVYNYFMELMDGHPDAATYDWEGHAIKPLMATVNFSLPIQMTSSGMPSTEDMLNAVNPNGTLYPFDNAFFMPGGPALIPGYERPYDSIVFGQGTLVDFGWDGDVIRHEFTHSVANSVSVGVGQYQDFGDEWGVNVEQGGMSEGYADIYPAFMSDEPTMGEYSLASFGPANVRDLSGADVCPDYLVGEVHADSPGWSQSVYQARTAAAGDDAGDKHAFEQAVFVGLSSVVQKQGFAEAAAATLEAVEALLGASAREAAAAVFAEHHTDDCPRVMADGGSGSVTKSSLAAPSAVNGAAGDPFTPGIIQYMVTIDGQQAVNLEFGLSGETEMQVLVRVGAPIEFSYSGTTVEIDEDVLGPFPMDGDHRFSLVSTSAALPAGEYYLMPVNVGAAAGTMSAIEATAGAAIAGTGGTQTYEGEGDDAGADGGPQVEGESSSGCGCDATGAPARRTPLLGLLLGR